jgi:signal peptidase
MLIDDSTFTLLKQSIKNNKWLELPAFGNSMFPFIKQGDHCRFVPLDCSSLTKGDILLYLRKEGQLIAHRFIETQWKNGLRMFLLKGDTNLGFDQPIAEERILGKLIAVQKKRVTITPDHFFAAAWGKMILSFPIISEILRKYLNSRFNLQY